VNFTTAPGSLRLDVSDVGGCPRVGAMQSEQLWRRLRGTHGFHNYLISFDSDRFWARTAPDHFEAPGRTAPRGGWLALGHSVWPSDCSAGRLASPRTAPRAGWPPLALLRKPAPRTAPHCILTSKRAASSSSSSAWILQSSEACSQLGKARRVGRRVGLSEE
jgi:hypothetical protein